MSATEGQQQIGAGGGVCAIHGVHGEHRCPDCEVEAPAFDGAAAEAAADAGEQRALHAKRVQQWKDNAQAWLDRQPSGTEFTADQLVAAIGLPDSGPARNNVVGAWISAQSQLGRISFTGAFRKSERVAGHGNLQRVWKV